MLPCFHFVHCMLTSLFVTMVCFHHTNYRNNKSENSIPVVRKTGGWKWGEQGGRERRVGRSLIPGTQGLLQGRVLSAPRALGCPSVLPGPRCPTCCPPVLPGPRCPACCPSVLPGPRCPTCCTALARNTCAQRLPRAKELFERPYPVWE